MKRIFPILAALALPFLCIVSACSDKQSAGNRSFCFWKTNPDISTEEDSMMRHLGIDHLYLHYFDVDWNMYRKEALPVGTISEYCNVDPQSREISPAVFITNAVMENIPETEIDSLAKKVHTRITGIIEKHADRYGRSVSEKHRHKRWENAARNIDSLDRFSDSVQDASAKYFKSQVKEILIDCDWTKSSKDTYFSFIKKLEKLFPEQKLAVSLRLWQYKDRKNAGIPPADRCLLMCYNLDNPAKYSIQNSICSIGELKKYETDEPYPIKMDVALPLFSSGVIFRQGAFKGLVAGAQVQDYLDDTLNYSPAGNNLFMFKSDMVIGNSFIRYGDRIRIEELSPGELEEIASYVDEHFYVEEDARVSFFSWDTNYINHFGIENINKYYRLLGH
jgi:hypothetical protein